jgi:hypothetical protein
MAHRGLAGTSFLLAVMPALDAGIHVAPPKSVFPMVVGQNRVDHRVKPGDDDLVGGCHCPRKSGMNPFSWGWLV